MDKSMQANSLFYYYDGIILLYSYFMDEKLFFSIIVCFMVKIYAIWLETTLCMLCIMNYSIIVAGLVVRMDSIAKQLDDNTKMLMQSVDQVNINCHNTVNNQTQFINNKVAFE